MVTLLIIATNVLAYLLETRVSCDTYGLIPAHFASEALVTSLFLHDPSSLLHLGGNMVFLAIFGTILEKELGGCLFLAIYLLAGASGGLMHILVNPGATNPLVGASGAIFGVMAVAGAARPRLLGFVFAFAGVSIWQAFTGGEGDISFGCHIGGFVAGVFVVMILRAIGNDALETA